MWLPYLLCFVGLFLCQSCGKDDEQRREEDAAAEVDDAAGLYAHLEFDWLVALEDVNDVVHCCWFRTLSMFLYCDSLTEGFPSDPTPIT